MFFTILTGFTYSFGTLSGLIAGRFVQQEDDHQDELRDLTAQVVCLRKMIEEHGLPRSSSAGPASENKQVVEDQCRAA